MPRYVDSLPTPHPDNVKEKKLIVLSAPRSGTQGLYYALQELGYKPYHMTELVTLGRGHVRMMIDAYDGEIGEGKQYTRQDFDKWWADYDVIIEMPFMMLRSTLAAYPEAKYLLVERDPESWAKSVENTIFQTGQMMASSLPMAIFARLSPGLRNMQEFSAKFKRRTTKGWAVEGEENKTGHANLVATYRDYVETIKREVPKDRLEIVKLEDGYGWEVICGCLGIPVPKDKPWPRKNTTEEFKTLAVPHIAKARKMASAVLAAMLIPLFGIGWALRTGRLSWPFVISVAFAWRK